MKLKHLNIIKKSAEKGDVDAQFGLGYFYDEGIGNEVNKEKAFIK